jgi:hypothetical protein
MLGIGTRLRNRGMWDAGLATGALGAACGWLRDSLLDGSIDPERARPQLDELLAEDWAPRFAHLLRCERASEFELAPYYVDGSAQVYWAPKLAIIKQVFPERLKELGLPDTEPSVIQRIQRTVGLSEGVSDWSWFGVPVDVVLGELRDLDRYLTADADPRSVWEQWQDKSSVGQRAIAPGWLHWILARADARGRLARLALAAYEHRRLNGAWPRAAADLAPLFPDGVPLDPFTGGPFLVEHDGDALVLRAQPWGGIDEESEQDLLYVWRLPPP